MASQKFVSNNEDTTGQWRWKRARPGGKRMIGFGQDSPSNYIEAMHGYIIMRIMKEFIL